MLLEINKVEDKIIVYRVTSEHITVELLNLGATISDIRQYNSTYRSESIVMKHAKYKDYLDNTMYLGATIGSYAGRIANSTFKIGNETFGLPSNDGTNFLHGGAKGLHTKFFASSVIEATLDRVVISFRTSLNEEDDTLPGSLNVEVIYTITPAAVKITFLSSSTEVRLSNITNHTYWNLGGNLRHQIGSMAIQAEDTAVWKNNEQMIPVEKIEPKGVLDFSKPTQFKQILNDRDNPLNTRERGLDNLFEIIPKKLVLSHKPSARSVSISSTYSHCVIYTQNERLTKPLSFWPRGTRHLGVAVEFQYPPNDVNTDHPMSIIRPGELKKEEVTFSFYTGYRRSVLRMLYGKNFK